MTAFMLECVYGGGGFLGQRGVCSEDRILFGERMHWHRSETESPPATGGLSVLLGQLKLRSTAALITANCITAAGYYRNRSMHSSRTLRGGRTTSSERVVSGRSVT